MKYLVLFFPLAIFFVAGAGLTTLIQSEDLKLLAISQMAFNIMLLQYMFMRDEAYDIGKKITQRIIKDYVDERDKKVQD